MTRRRSFLRNAIEYGLFRIALGLLAYAPVPLAFGLGSVYARMLDRLVPRLRRSALGNLQEALPELSPRERSIVVDGVFRSIGRVMTTFARFPRLHRDNIDQWIRCEGLRHVEAALVRGRGVLFATAHLGNWELSAFAFALLRRPIHIVVRPLDNPLIDAVVTRYREMPGNRSISKRNYARGIFDALARNEMVGILADQNTQNGVGVEFFGLSAAASPALVRIAAKTGAAIVPGFALWSEAERKFVLRFYPEVPAGADMVEGTQRVQSAFEEAIRQYPDQWLWVHRRWKRQPERKGSDALVRVS